MKKQSVYFPKCKAEELFRKVFGTAKYIEKDPAYNPEYAKGWRMYLGSLYIECSRTCTNNSVLCVSILFEDGSEHTLYYDPDTLDLDTDYTMRARGFVRRSDAFDYITEQNYAVVKRRDAELYDLSIINDGLIEI